MKYELSDCDAAVTTLNASSTHAAETRALVDATAGMMFCAWTGEGERRRGANTTRTQDHRLTLTTPMVSM